MPTMGIKHRAESGFRMLSALNKLGFGGQESASKPPQAICKPLQPAKKKKDNTT